MNDDFYIGWESRATPATRRFLRRVLLMIFILTAALPVALAVSQHLIGSSVFEWGHVRTVAGILQARPYPHLLVARPGNTREESAFSTYYLVAPWKFGLSDADVASFDGQSVTLQGTLIYRDNQTLIEVRPGSIHAAQATTTWTTPKNVPLGHQTLAGEIIDSKCFLGVMNPGQLAPHRACAIRCISGGCPPVLVVPQAGQPPLYFLLVSSSDQPVNQQVLDFVAEPVRITGEVERQGDLLILRADPSTYQRIR